MFEHVIAKISRPVIGLIRKIHTNRRKPGIFTPFFIAMIVLTGNKLVVGRISIFSFVSKLVNSKSQLGSPCKKSHTTGFKPINYFFFAGW